MNHHIFSGKIILVLVLVCIASLQVSAESAIQPVGLRCEQMATEALINTDSPRFSWIDMPLDKAAKNLSQSAYRIVVSSSDENLAEGRYDVWDSRRVKSAKSRLVPYGGVRLKPESKFFWKVKVWDNNGNESDWSEQASFGTGVDKWNADWIGGNLLMKQLNITKPVKSARIFATAMGYFDVNVNGRKVGDDYFVPNFTNFTCREGFETHPINIGGEFSGYRLLYLAYDIDTLLTVGKNCITVNLGNGFANSINQRSVRPYGEPRFIAKINIEYADGTEDVVCTDGSWMQGDSPIVYNNVYFGEIYDANIKEHAWRPAKIMEAPCGDLTPQSSPSDKVTAVYKPVSFTQTEKGTYIVEFPEEISGWIRFNGVEAQKGDTIEVKYFCESPLGVHKYVSDGSPAYYNPRFTWYVFSKAEISGARNLKPDQIIAEAVNTDVRENAVFESSEPLLGRIMKIWRRSQKDNMHSCLPSDCPHRERLPYTGDGQLAQPAVMANFDAEAFYKKWMRDIRDSQNPSDGYVPNGAPWQPGCGGGVAWGAAMTLMPWEYYLSYGDVQTLAENYPAMLRQIEYMKLWMTPDGTMYQQKGNDGAPDAPVYWLNLGEWVTPFGLPSEELVHTYYLWKCADYAAKAAHTLGFSPDEKKYATFRDDVATAFHKKFYNRETGDYGPFGANIFALAIGVPQDYRAGVVEALRKELMEEHDGHLTTGIFGTRLLFETLASYGMNDDALAIITAKGFPGFVNWLDQGATVTWEQWDGKNSRNHPMFGAGLTWYNTTLAGLKPDTVDGGFRNFAVEPVHAKGLDQVKWQQTTPYGEIIIDIDYTKGMSVTVPVGSTARIVVPWSGEESTVGQGTYYFPRN